MAQLKVDQISPELTRFNRIARFRKLYLEGLQRNVLFEKVLHELVWTEEHVGSCNKVRLKDSDMPESKIGIYTSMFISLRCRREEQTSIVNRALKAHAILLKGNRIES